MCVKTESVCVCTRLLQETFPSHCSCSGACSSTHWQQNDFVSNRLFLLGLGLSLSPRLFFFFFLSLLALTPDSVSKRVPSPGSVNPQAAAGPIVVFLSAFLLPSMPKVMSSAFTHTSQLCWLPHNHTFISSPLWTCYSPPSHLLSLAHVRIKLCCHLLVKKGNSTSKSDVISTGA